MKQWELEFLAIARSDIFDAIRWYEEQAPGLGDDFNMRLVEVFTRIEKMPELFQIRFRFFRQAMTRRFPYRVFYRIRGNQVIVVRVLHASRDYTRLLPKH